MADCDNYLQCQYIISMFGFVLVIVKQYQKEFAQVRRKPAATIRHCI